MKKNLYNRYRRFSFCLVLFFLLNFVAPLTAQRVQLFADYSEAEQVLSIIKKNNNQIQIDDSDWNKLFHLIPYQKLKDREASFNNVQGDADFKEFILSGELAQTSLNLDKTLREWRSADLDAIGKMVLSYLPDNASIKAKVFILIKPSANSFVWGKYDVPQL